MAISALTILEFSVIKVDLLLYIYIQRELSNFQSIMMDNQFLCIHLRACIRKCTKAVIISTVGH